MHRCRLSPLTLPGNDCKNQTALNRLKLHNQYKAINLSILCGLGENAFERHSLRTHDISYLQWFANAFITSLHFCVFVEVNLSKLNIYFDFHLFGRVNWAVGETTLAQHHCCYVCVNIFSISPIQKNYECINNNEKCAFSCTIKSFPRSLCNCNRNHFCAMSITTWATVCATGAHSVAGRWIRLDVRNAYHAFLSYHFTIHTVFHIKNILAGLKFYFFCRLVAIAHAFRFPIKKTECNE